MRRPKPSKAVTAFVKITGCLPALLYLRPKVIVSKNGSAKRRLPKPCLLVSNHRSLMDFVLYLTVFPFRNIRFLMAEVLFTKSKALSWLLFKLGGIYVNRTDFDFSFAAESVEELDRGGSVGIFPQSRLPVGDKEWPFTPSVVHIALNSGAPIVPVYTDGNYGFGRRAHVVIGEEIRLCELCRDKNPDKDEVERLTRYLESKVFELKEEAK